MARNDRPNLGNSREWAKRDERKDRGVTEGPVSKAHQAAFGDQTVDAVPGTHYRPGRHN